MDGRKQVKTYSRRNRPLRTVLGGVITVSSPLQELHADREDISRSEMAKRMLKRSRRSSEGAHEPRMQDNGHSKRMRRTDPDSNSVPALDNFHVDPNDPSQFQTPFPSQSSDKTIHTSAKVAASDGLSPLPVARRMLSRRSSRNLKENKSRSKHFGSRSRTHSRSNSHGIALASPFHSRPGSQTSSPKKKSQAKQTIYRTNSDKNREPVFSMNQSAHNSPRSRSKRSSRHIRVPSLPTNMLPEDVDWLVPAKSLNRDPLTDIALDHEDYFFDADGSFYGGMPLAYSTPLPKTLNGMYAVDSPALEDNDDIDVIMHDPDPKRPRKQVYHSRDSIFTDSDEYSTTESSPSHRPKQSISGLRLPYSSSPLDFGFLEHRLSFLEPEVASPSPWNVLADPFAAFDSVIATPPASPAHSPAQTAEHGNESPVGYALQNMLDSLELQDDSGISLSDLPPSSNHLRSLESPADIITTTTKKSHAPNHKRSRAGTIKASDFALPQANANMRRTRSGTVIGPLRPAIARKMSLNTQNVTLPEEDDDNHSSLHVFSKPQSRNLGRRTRSGTIIGPPSKFPQTVLEKIGLLDAGSEDELLLQPGKEGVLDDDWIICNREGDDVILVGEIEDDELNIRDEKV